jgi:hypothetical protein
MGIWLKKYQYIQYGAVQTCYMVPTLMTRGVESEIVCGYILYLQQIYNNGHYAQKWITQYCNNQSVFPTVLPHEQKPAQHIHLITLHLHFLFSKECSFEYFCKVAYIWLIRKKKKGDNFCKRISCAISTA